MSAFKEEIVKKKIIIWCSSSLIWYPKTCLISCLLPAFKILLFSIFLTLQLADLKISKRRYIHWQILFIYWKSWANTRLKFCSKRFDPCAVYSWSPRWSSLLRPWQIFNFSAPWPLPVPLTRRFISFSH